ncbi:MAG TPA: aquaporin [Candidatus Solibacter sp.]|nr:aquaporin [Candidatus Solibacter sp.]
MEALRAHWPEYLMEAAALGMFMVSACVFGVLLEHFAGLASRVPAGVAMGLTAVAIISSPWGQRSGAHMNPAVTLTFLSLGKIAPWDALFYAVAQFAGGVAGVLLSAQVLGAELARVQFVATVPGPGGPWAAFAAEFAISFLLISVVLNVANSRRFTRFTPWVTGFLVAAFISVESPLSGMSMNPARTVGSAFSSGIWTAIWVYFVAPPLAMVSAGQLYRHWRGAHRIFCAKYHHHNEQRCIFRCNYGALHEP